MLPIQQDFISQGASNRPGKSMTPKYITVHNTGDTNAGANAKAEAEYVKSQDAIDRDVSWHFTVDDVSIYQHLPLNETAYHCTDGGDGPGNSTSIGIEICVNSDGDYSKAEANAIELIRWLMGQFNIPLDNVVSHQHWYPPKYCPYKILPRWSAFINTVKGVPVALTPKPVPPVIVPKSITYVDQLWPLTMKDSDTFYSVARAYNITVDALQKANPTLVPTAIRPGTRIQVPVHVPVYPLLKMGDQGEAVKTLQVKLTKLNFYAGAIDGVFGSTTQGAIVGFQKSKTLTADGIVGTNTWNALMK